MRLLQIEDGGGFSLVEYVGRDIPRYAILSHTWGADNEEVTFRDLVEGAGKSKTGYRKLSFCRKQAASNGLQFFWVDTCCIDKSSSVELQEAINSMFQWYHKADKCYVYLSDVSIDGSGGGEPSTQQAWKRAFQDSRWFTRGWTLQELLAPTSVEFFSTEGKRLGNKASLLREIYTVTGIYPQALQGDPLHQFSIELRLSWAERRETKREEDKAYALLGIFGVHIPLIYGEGKNNAFRRLREEINKSSKDLMQQQALSQICRGQPDMVWGMEGVSEAPWVVPFTRPPSFAGREVQLAQLHAHIASEGSQWLAIYGLGGCGKTALALESAYRTRELQPIRAVFWVPAISPESFEQAYREIGTLLRIPGIADDKADVKRLVEAKLSDEGFGPWLMIVDNADDTSVLFDQLEREISGDRLIDFLPSSRRGSVVFTTRTRQAAIDLAGGSVIQLGELDEEEAEEVLRTRLLPNNRHLLKGDKTVHEFIDMLAFLALAIVQAAAFINKNNTTLSDYISVYRSSEMDAIELLSKEFEDHGRYRDTKNPVATTWYISFKQIQRQNPLAADYLSFMACTTGENIPSSLLLPGSSKLATIEAIGTLDAYTFASERRQLQKGDAQYAEKMFDMHRLVRLATHNWLREYGQWQSWVDRALVRLVEVVPFGDYNKREVWTAYLSHAAHVADLAEVYDAEDRMSLLDRIGGCEQTLGRYKAAEVAHRKVLKRREEVFGKEHPDTLTSMNSVAVALGNQAKYAEAEQMHQETLALWEKVSGKEHPNTLISMNNMAQALSRQGKYAEARKMLQETLALEEKVLGKEHPHTLISMHNLAQALSGQGKYAEAENMHQKTLVLKEKVLGKEHPYTLMSMNDVGLALSVQGKYAEAEKMHRETLALWEKVSGEEHPNTLISMSNMAQALSGQGEYAEAGKMHQKTLVLKEKVLGKEHPETLISMNDVGLALSNQGKYTEAEQMHQETLVLREKVSGKEHRNTLMSMHNLAQVLGSQGKYAEAEKMHRETLVLREKVLGKEHPETLISRNDIGLALSNQGKYTEAEQMHQETLALDEKVLGKEHQETLMSMHNLAQVLGSQGKYAEAEKMHREMLVLREKVLGKEHPVTLTSVNCLAYTLRQQERYGDALSLYHRAYTGYEDTLGLSHPTTQACLSHYSSLRQLCGLDFSSGDGPSSSSAQGDPTHSLSQQQPQPVVLETPKPSKRRRLV